MCDFQVQYGLVLVLVTNDQSNADPFFLAHDFNVDVSSSTVLAGYFHFKAQ